MAKRKIEHNAQIPTELIIPVDEFKKLIEERIQIGEKIFNQEVRSQIDFDSNKKDFNDWDDYNSEFLKQSFNNEHNEYKERYDDCGIFIGLYMRPQTPSDKLKIFKEKIDSKLSNLKKLLGKADLLKCSVAIVGTSSRKVTSEETNSNNIFIVHGHDEKTILDVARTVEKLGLIPIILSEQPNQGQTIIEKFELHSNVGFSIILLTADDLGKVKTDEEEKYRARQNVILEMGYFIGKLGRNKVFPLYESGVELPSDLHGMLYNPLDEGSAWKFKLAKELNAAGYMVDANKLL